MGHNHLTPPLLRLGRGGTNRSSLSQGGLLYGNPGPGNPNIVFLETLSPRNPGDSVRMKLGLPVSFPGDRIIQIVSSTCSIQSAFSDTVNWIPTGLACGITPQFVDSQILIMVNQTGIGKVGSSNCGLGLSLWRNAVNLGQFGFPIGYSSDNTQLFPGTAGHTYLDTPNTLSLVTYATKGLIVVASGNALCQWNSQTVSTLVLMEVAV